jgi:hypothetical protein
MNKARIMATIKMKRDRTLIKTNLLKSQSKIYKKKKPSKSINKENETKRLKGKRNKGKL